VSNYVGKAGSAVFNILTVFDTVMQLLFDSQNHLFNMVGSVVRNWTACKSFNWKCCGVL